jgi:putative FmdB family regulatory protein
MTTYDYRCNECGEVFEAVYSMAEPSSKTIHKKCGNICSKVILKAPVFEEAFPGSYRETNPKKVKW